MESQRNSDNWSSLLSELGLETPSEKGSFPSTAAETVEVSTVVESQPVAKEELKKSIEASVDAPKRGGEGKRTFFDRFPKINLFGAPAKDPLDAVVSGTKPSVKSGETFTSKKLEKVEPSPGRTSRRETEPVAAPTAVPDASFPEEKPISRGRDPWSRIASQVGHLSVAESVEETSFETTEPVARTETVSKPPTTREFVREKPKRESENVPRRGRRSPPSMFDDEPVAESEESTAFRNILAVEEQKPYAEAAERLSSIFDDTPVRTERERESEPERREPRQHVRGRRHQEQERDQNTGRPPRDRNGDHRDEERQTDERKRGERLQEERQTDERKRGERSQEERWPTDRKRNDQSEERNVTDRNVTDRNVTDRNVTDRNVTDRNVTDRNVTDRNVTERKRVGRSFEERIVNEPERGRGSRGSRYAEKDRSESERWERDDRQPSPSEQDRPYTPQPVVDEYEPEAIWDVEDESKPVERSGRRRFRRSGRGESEADRSPSPRYRETRSEETGSDHADDHVFPSPNDFEQLHRSIPSWDDAVSSLVESNIARHAKRGSDQRRGRH